MSNALDEISSWTNQSGLGSVASRLTMVVVWAAYCVHLLAGPHTLSWYQVAAMSLLLIASLAVTKEASEPLSAPDAWRVAVPAGVALVLGPLPAPVGAVPVWIICLAGFQLGFIAIRGSVKIAWITLGLALAILALIGRVVDSQAVFIDWLVESLPGSIFGGLALTAGTLWRKFLVLFGRRTVQAELDRAAESALEQRAEQRMRIRSDELRTVADLAGELLERAASRTLTDSDPYTARIIEAMVRDRLRAPRLSIGPMVLAVRRARERGSQVALLDDGDRSIPMKPQQYKLLIDLIEQCSPESRVTIRLLPVGRKSSGTISIISPDSALLKSF